MKNKNYMVFCICAGLFLVLILLLRTVDVAPIGPEGTSIGLSHLNQAVHQALGENLTWYKVTDILVYLCFLLAALMLGLIFFRGLRQNGWNQAYWKLLIPGALYVGVLLFYMVFVDEMGAEGIAIGAAQLTRTQLGILCVLCAALMMGLLFFLCRPWNQWRPPEQELPGLVLLYGTGVFFYFFFDTVAVNYRPVLMPDGNGPEASFPSSHTLVACVILDSIILISRKYLRKPAAVQGACAALMFLIMFGRLLSGVHWFTDIFGCLLLSGALLAAYAGATAEE